MKLLTGKKGETQRPWLRQQHVHSKLPTSTHLIFSVDNNQVPQTETTKQFKYPWHWSSLHKKQTMMQTTSTAGSK